MKTILITGGAGFVGSSLALLFKQQNESLRIICLDNLSRRGSELNVARLLKQGIEFAHGDVRNPEDLAKIGQVDCLIECSAEPSVHAGYGQSPAYLINTNLIGLINCLEFLRERGGDLVFLSTSRVYPISDLRNLPLNPVDKRFVLAESGTLAGVSEGGISESFSLKGARSLYGATKLCGEILIQEYANMYGLRAIINRCGVLAGPWQMGKVDQGFMALWVARHRLGGELKYMGFGGEGLQVRDVLHVNDLFELIQLQMKEITTFQNEIYNVGGGLQNSVSLAELSQIVQAITQKSCHIGTDPVTRDADIPYYVTDISKIKHKANWEPKQTIENIVHDIDAWLQSASKEIHAVFQN